MTNIGTTNVLITNFPLIKNGEFLYNSGGETTVDKNSNLEKKEYTYKDNVISVERHFSQKTKISDLIKGYIIEEKGNNTLPIFSEKCYNGSCNTTVVDISERRSK